jgi:ABC-2 type transport system permease protein
MKKYLLVCKLAFQDVMEYRFDLLVRVAKYSLMVVLMSLVWIAVAKESSQPLFTNKETVSYFVFAAILYSLSNFHPYYIEQDIRMGSLTKYLVKPVTPFWYYFWFEGSRVFTEVFIRVGCILPLLWMFGFQFQTSLVNLAMVVLFMPVIFFFTFSFFVLISAFAFWIQDVYAIRWTLSIFSRFLSGVLVPISFFPENVQKITFFLPFQHLAFTPIQILQNKISFQEAWLAFGVLFVWTLAMYGVQTYVWMKGEHEYEGGGI